MPDRHKKKWRKMKRLTYRIRHSNGLVCKSKISTKYMLISIYLTPLLYHTFYLKPIPKWKVLKVFSNRPLAEMLKKKEWYYCRFISVCLCAGSIISICWITNRRWVENLLYMSVLIFKVKYIIIYMQSVFATKKGKNEHFYKKLKNLVSPCK